MLVISGINPLIGFKPLIFELSTFIFWEGKKREKPLEIVDPGVGFEKGRFDAP